MGTTARMHVDLAYVDHILATENSLNNTTHHSSFCFRYKSITIVVETAESTVIVGRCYLYYSEACIASYLQSNNVLSTFISRILLAVRCLFRRIKNGDAW